MVKILCPGCYFSHTHHTLKVIIDNGEEVVLSRCQKCGRISLWRQEDKKNDK